MCVGCLITSAILAFSPVQTGTAPQQPQANLTQQRQIAIARVIKQLPASNDVKLLREGLESIQGQLSVAIDDNEAQQILKTEVASLSQRITADSNGKFMFETLDRIITEDDTPSLWQQKSLSNQKAPSFQWGWLKH
ncbi:hypothetical protein [Pseudanabaena sp. PCC 6802]|uniref:hypothetical protein n=1 Tax=Pseudanabaena sp. PCC 6802 TaxID=118173 RepID=UPI000346DC76|nr:hypothetical protein [Pseudanabaena sp. PCC 6802]